MAFFIGLDGCVGFSGIERNLAKKKNRDIKHTIVI
jgi:hypothetical protein